MRIASRFAAALPLSLAAAFAGAAEPRLPATVAAWVKAAADTCREVEGKPDATKAVQRADLNGDGIEDFVISVDDIDCEGAASIYGDREKAMVVFAGDGKGGATPVFDDSVYGTRIEKEGARAKLWLTVMGAQCGKKPAKDFASENFCDRPLVWDPVKRRFDYAPVSSVKMIQ
jgi:hypothetical protein